MLMYFVLGQSLVIVHPGPSEVFVGMLHSPIFHARFHCLFFFTFADTDQAFVDSLNERIAALSSTEDVRNSIDQVRSSDRFVGDAAQLASTSDDDLADSLNTRISDIVQNRQFHDTVASLTGKALLGIDFVNNLPC
jgi:hypothetical protein